MKLIIASNNPGKIREYKDIFEPYGFQVLSQGETDIRIEVEETGTTFEQNAILKARAIYDAVRCCVISDDSGLEVEALGGEPGLYSARYQGLETEHERRLAVLKGLEGSDNRRKEQTALDMTRSSYPKTETERQRPACRFRSRRHIHTGRKRSVN